MPHTSLRYQSGFANHFTSEALAGALPAQNSPQRCPYGLYAEQLSGTAFTAPRASNRRSWLYRIRPAVQHLPFRRIDNRQITNDFAATTTPPPPPVGSEFQYRLLPFQVPVTPTATLAAAWLTSQ